MTKHDMILTIVRQYGGKVEKGMNWNWVIFDDRARATTLDTRGQCSMGFRYRY
jgi:hypothetical protein